MGRVRTIAEIRAPEREDLVTRSTGRVHAEPHGDARSGLSLKRTHGGTRHGSRQHQARHSLQLIAKRVSGNQWRLAPGARRNGPLGLQCRHS